MAHGKRKICEETVWRDPKEHWTVKFGRLKRPPGSPGKTPNLFRCVGEKLPFDSLGAVRKKLEEAGVRTQGVYVAHDSMGCPRYVGRGRIFSRLASRRAQRPHELVYFSFYVVENKNHEREIETLIIRTAGFLLEFNDRKKRVSIAPGDLCDYEVGTLFFERQHKKGRKTIRVLVA